MQRRYPRQLKILVVDNNPLLQRALKEMLEQWGVGQVATAHNGQEAKEILRREPFDMLVTDWVMEPVNGAQLVTWVRRSPGSLNPNLPVIVLTAHSDLPTVYAAWDAGVDAVLAKPASAATIAQRIEAVLNRPRCVGRPRRPDAGDVPPSAEPSTGAARPTPPPALPARLAPIGLPAPDTPLRVTDPKKLRLLIALDRLEAAIEHPDASGARLRRAVTDAQLAATGNHGAIAVVASLSTCITWAEPEADGYDEAVRAHAAALRWIVASNGSADTLAAARALIRSLRAMVRGLTLRTGAEPGADWSAGGDRFGSGHFGADGSPRPPN